MAIIADLHIHGRFSRATSKQLDVANLEKYARIKGANLLGTGDFTHSGWVKEIRQNLEEDDSGILKTKTGFPFVWQTEISLMYSQGGKGRRVHNVILAPSYDVVRQITEYLGKRGRLDYDGRPIFKIPCIEFTESMMGISRDIEVIPAHIWTPWFSLFGSKSGFDSVKDCFGDQAKNIHALETGLSSDPAMNWRLSQLDDFSLVSFSDLHSFWPWRMARETTLFDISLTYKNLIKALRTKEGLAGTIEVDPAYGKYHADGHRLCSFCSSPDETEKIKGICPKCGKPLTIGVWNRVEELADRPEGYRPENALPFKSLIPLSEIISSVQGWPLASKKTWQEYYKLVSMDENRSEYTVLLETPLSELKKLTSEKTAEAVMLNREGKIRINPGYDGEYGVPLLGEQKQEKDAPEKPVRKKGMRQAGIGDFC